MTTKNHITQLPDDIQDLIFQQLHQSHMKNVTEELLSYVEPFMYSMRWWEIAETPRDRAILLLVSTHTLNDISLIMYSCMH